MINGYITIINLSTNYNLLFEKVSTNCMSLLPKAKYNQIIQPNTILDINNVTFCINKHLLKIISGYDKIIIW